MYDIDPLDFLSADISEEDNTYNVEKYEKDDEEEEIQEDECEVDD